MTGRAYVSYRLATAPEQPRVAEDHQQGVAHAPGESKTTGLDPTRTAIQAPWQNGAAERWVGSCRRELLDHIIALNERHLSRLIHEYVAYYHDDCIHDSLEKDAPKRRPIEPKPSARAMVMSTARAGGLHHRYAWRDAA